MKTSTWINKAFHAVLTSFAKRQPTFLAEGLRPMVVAKAGSPSHPNHWGMLTRLLQNKGWIEKTGKLRPSQLDSNHSRMAFEYKWTT